MTLFDSVDATPGTVPAKVECADRELQGRKKKNRKNVDVART